MGSAEWFSLTTRCGIGNCNNLTTALASLAKSRLASFKKSVTRKCPPLLLRVGRTSRIGDVFSLEAGVEELLL